MKILFYSISICFLQRLEIWWSWQLIKKKWKMKNGLAHSLTSSQEWPKSQRQRWLQNLDILYFSQKDSKKTQSYNFGFHVHNFNFSAIVRNSSVELKECSQLTQITIFLFYFVFQSSYALFFAKFLFSHLTVSEQWIVSSLSVIHHSSIPYFLIINTSSSTFK